MNPTPPESGPTPEHMLARVIEAQVAGGYRRYQDADCHRIIAKCSPFSSAEPASCVILGPLLDPAGLRAAYPDPNTDWTGQGYNHSNGVAKDILFAWLSTPDGSAEAAIKTAFDLLPSKP